MSIIEARGLVKHYEEVKVLDGLDFVAVFAPLSVGRYKKAKTKA